MKSLNFANQPVRRTLLPGTFRTCFTVFAAGTMLAVACSKTDKPALNAQNAAPAATVIKPQTTPSKPAAVDTSALADTVKAEPPREKPKGLNDSLYVAASSGNAQAALALSQLLMNKSLYEAAIAADVQAVTELLPKGADPDTKGRFDMTPLAWVARLWHVGEEQDRIRYKDRKGVVDSETVKLHRKNLAYAKITNLLIDADADVNADVLDEAIGNCNYALVKRLIQKHVFVNDEEAERNAYPPLCDALGWWHGQYRGSPAMAKIIRSLIDAGANPNDTVDGWLHWARMRDGVYIPGFQGLAPGQHLNYPVADFLTCNKCLKRVAKRVAETRMEKAVVALCRLRLAKDVRPLDLGAQVQAEQGLTDSERNAALLDLFYIEQGKIPKDLADK